MGAESVTKVFRTEKTVKSLLLANSKAVNVSVSGYLEIVFYNNVVYVTRGLAEKKAVPAQISRKDYKTRILEILEEVRFSKLRVLFFVNKSTKKIPEEVKQFSTLIEKIGLRCRMLVTTEDALRSRGTVQLEEFVLLEK